MLRFGVFFCVGFVCLTCTTPNFSTVCKQSQKLQDLENSLANGGIRIGRGTLGQDLSLPRAGR